MLDHIIGGDKMTNVKMPNEAEVAYPGLTALIVAICSIRDTIEVKITDKNNSVVFSRHSGKRSSNFATIHINGEYSGRVYLRQIEPEDENHWIEYRRATAQICDPKFTDANLEKGKEHGLSLKKLISKKEQWIPIVAKYLKTFD
jgi:hypothetical protein